MTLLADNNGCIVSFNQSTQYYRVGIEPILPLLIGIAILIVLC